RGGGGQTGQGRPLPLGCGGAAGTAGALSFPGLARRGTRLARARACIGAECGPRNQSSVGQSGEGGAVAASADLAESLAPVQASGGGALYRLPRRPLPRCTPGRG